MNPTNTTTDMEKRPLLSTSRLSPGQEEEEEEPSLSTLRHNASAAQKAYMRAWSRTTSGKWHKRLMLSVTILLLAFAAFSFSVILTADDWDDDIDFPPYPPLSHKVPLEAHIMSKCPDAQTCLHDLILPSMQQISPLVDFKLSYIGHANNKTTGDDDSGVTCPHGPSECLGDIIELCAAKLYPDPRIYLGFTMCLTREYDSIPDEDLVSDCALEHGVDMEKLNECSVDENGALAVEALKKSFKRSEEAGVTKSCTVRLDGEVRCIVDGGEWKECAGGHKPADLVRDVKELAAAKGGW